MNLKVSLNAVAACIFTLFVNAASAAIINLEASLDGAQANAGAGTGSAGTGSATITFDDVSNLLSWDISWSGLVNETAAHFHGPANPGQNAGVQVGIGVASNPAVGSATISDAQEADLLAGLWYINIHTAQFPGGEIRGQVQVVPIPAAIWLFGTGILGLIAVAKRKARA